VRRKRAGNLGRAIAAGLAMEAADYSQLFKAIEKGIGKA